TIRRLVQERSIGDRLEKSGRSENERSGVCERSFGDGKSVVNRGHHHHRHGRGRKGGNYRFDQIIFAITDSWVAGRGVERVLTRFTTTVDASFAILDSIRCGFARTPWI